MDNVEGIRGLDIIGMDKLIAPLVGYTADYEGKALHAEQVLGVC